MLLPKCCEASQSALRGKGSQKRSRRSTILKEAERAWVDGYLNFRGRIDRDDWVKQADALARGGVDEYIRVFGKKPV